MDPIRCFEIKLLNFPFTSSFYPCLKLGVFKILGRITKILFALVFHLKQFESIPSFPKMQKQELLIPFTRALGNLLHYLHCNAAMAAIQRHKNLNLKVREIKSIQKIHLDHQDACISNLEKFIAKKSCNGIACPYYCLILPL